MVCWLAPIMSFTADEIWQFMPGKRNESVFLNTWFTDFPVLKNQNQFDWQWLMQVRDDVNKKLENYRAEGKIGSALDAEIVLHAAGEQYQKLKSLGAELRFLLITSDARVIEKPSALEIDIIISEHPKCARCWQRRVDVNADATHPELCGRCVVNITSDGEVRQFA